MQVVVNVAAVYEREGEGVAFILFHSIVWRWCWWWIATVSKGYPAGYIYISSKDIDEREREREKEKLKTLRMYELLLALLYVLDPTRTATVAHYFRYFMTKEKWGWS